MNAIKRIFSRILAASVALVVIVISLPLTLLLASITLALGAAAAFHLRYRMRQAQRDFDLNQTNSAHSGTPPDHASRWFGVAPKAASVDGVVIDHVKVDGVWRER